MHSEHEDPVYGYPYQWQDLPAACQTGLRIVHRYLR
jgi:hypothetical protein